MVGLVVLDLTVPQIVRRLVALVKTGGNGKDALRDISILACVLFTVFLLRGVFQFVQSYMNHKAGWGVVSDLRRTIYEHVQRQSLRFHDDQQTGRLMSRIVNDTELFERLIAHALPDTLVNVLTLCGVSAVLLTINVRLMLLTLIPMPFMGC